MTTAYSVFKAKFKKTIADAIYQEVTSKTALYYHWFGKENPWTDFLSPFIPSSEGDYPGQPSDNFRYDLHVRRDILTAKKIKPSDVSYVVRRIDWSYGTVYDMYDDAYTPPPPGYGYGPAYSGATRLEDANFYVLTTEYNVYKCIWNADDSPSTVMPSGTTPDVFDTSDGYKWKFMYSIPVSLRNRFLSSTYMPITTALNAAYFAGGSITSVNIEASGANYDPLHTSAVITGDGHKETNPYLLTEVQIDEPGEGYTTTPTVAISDPFVTAGEWISGGSVSSGSIIKYTNPLDNHVNFYRVISGTTLGISGPVDTSGSIFSNGSSQLRYVGTTAILSITMDGDAIDTVSIDYYGYGYNSQPTITIDPPFVKDYTWTQSTSYSTLGDIIEYSGRFYEVTVTGSSGGTGPTHTSGAVMNGTVELTYIGKQATMTPIIVKTEAEISLIFGGGGEIVGYTIVDAGIGYTNCNIEIVDTSRTVPEADKAILTVNFSVGDVDTLQANVELLAIPGSIEVIKVVEGGSGYGAATVQILGDGTNAEAHAVCSGGKVTHIIMDNVGSGYSWTEVIITGNPGSTGAIARAIMSPIRGHGSNAIDELNASSLVFYTSISRDKNQGIEINNDYRKVGLVRNFNAFGTNRRFTDDIGSGCVLVTGNFDKTKLDYDMLLYKIEGPGLTNYKKYRIVDFTDTQILLSVFNNFTINVGDTLITDPTDMGNIPNSPQPVTQIAVTSVTERTIDQFSGDFLFFSVREPYSPTAEQTITVRTVLSI